MKTRGRKRLRKTRIYFSNDCIIETSGTLRYIRSIVKLMLSWEGVTIRAIESEVL